MIPYGRHTIDEQDIQAVIEVLRSNWLTTGPLVAEFENAVSRYCNAPYGVAVANGTAALHTAMYAAGIGAGDEVITSPITFAASANAAIYLGGTPVFADVEEDTLLLDPCEVEKKITTKTRAVVAVDFAGQTCDYDALKAICNSHNLTLIADSCHAIGADHKGQKTGSLADLTVFSFHPVKIITTGEGGMVLTQNKSWVKAMRQFRNHGITSDLHDRAYKDSWVYNIEDLGYNYRITDIQCGLGLSQLQKLDRWVERRNRLANLYKNIFNEQTTISPLVEHAHSRHAYHLFVVKVPAKKRKYVFEQMRARGIAVNVHYIPVHLHPYYQSLGYEKGTCPVAERAYESLLTLPIFPGLTDKEVQFIADNLIELVNL